MHFLTGTYFEATIMLPNQKISLQTKIKRKIEPNGRLLVFLAVVRCHHAKDQDHGAVNVQLTANNATVYLTFGHHQTDLIFTWLAATPRHTNMPMNSEMRNNG